MDNIAGKKSALTWAVNIAVVALVALWVFPTLGLLISSFRTGDQISSSGWWRSMMPTEQNLTLRTASGDEQELIDGLYTVSGNLFALEDMEPLEISAFGTSSRDVGAHAPGDTVDMGDGEIVTVEANGDYVFTSVEEMSGRGQRVFVTAEVAPEFTLQNYDNMLFNPNNIEGMSKAFFNTLTVSIPATIIPILVAAFAAYALAWMDFPGRALLIAAIVGLLVVPLQLALIPLLKLHNEIGIGKGYMGVWLAHTGFGLPLAIYILRNYMVGLPRDIIENAKVDGASVIQTSTTVI